MKIYKVYIGMLDLDEKQSAVELFSKMEWSPVEDEKDTDFWFLIVPNEDENVLWFLENSGVMEIWEEIWIEIPT